MREMAETLIIQPKVLEVGKSTRRESPWRYANVRNGITWYQMGDVVQKIDKEIELG